MDKGYIIAVIYDKKDNIIGYVITYFVNNCPVQKQVSKQSLIDAVKNNRVSLGNARLITNGFAGTIYALTDLVSLTLDKGVYKPRQTAGILALIHFKDNNTVLLTALCMKNGVYSMEFKTVPVSVASKTPLINRNKDTGKVELTTIENKQRVPEKKEQPVATQQTHKPQNTQQSVTQQPQAVKTQTQEVQPQVPAKSLEDIEKEKREQLEAILSHNRENRKGLRIAELEEKMLDPNSEWRFKDFKEYMKLKGFSYKEERKEITKYVRRNRRSVAVKHKITDISELDPRCDKFRTFLEEGGKDNKRYTYTDLFKPDVNNEIKWLFIDSVAELSKGIVEEINPLSLEEIILRDNTSTTSTDRIKLNNAVPAPVQGLHKVKKITILGNKTLDAGADILSKSIIGVIKPISTLAVHLYDGNESTLYDIDLSEVSSITIGSGAFNKGVLFPDKEELDLTEKFSTIYYSFNESKVPKKINVHTPIFRINTSFNGSTVEEINFLFDEQPKSHTPSIVELKGLNKTAIRKISIPFSNSIAYSGLRLCLSGFNDCPYLEDFNYDERYSIIVRKDFLNNTPNLNQFIINNKFELNLTSSEPMRGKADHMLDGSNAKVIFRKGTLWSGELIALLDNIVGYDIEDEEIDLTLSMTDKHIEGSLSSSEGRLKETQLFWGNSETKLTALRRQFSDLLPEIRNKISSIGPTTLLIQETFDTGVFNRDITISRYAFQNEQVFNFSSLRNEVEGSRYHGKEVRFLPLKTLILRDNIRSAFSPSKDVTGKFIIEENQIHGFTNLNTLIINSNKITAIKGKAITECPALTQLAIGPHITSIEPNAFEKLNNVGKLKVYVLRGTVADKFFCRKQAKFETIYVDSMEEAEDLMLNQGIDPRKIAKYKLVLMNSEFGPMLNRTSEEIWEQSKQIYQNFLASSSTLAVLDSLNTQKLNIIRELKSDEEPLIRAIDNFQDSYYSQLQNWYTGNIYTKEKLKFNAVCNLITKVSNMHDVAYDNNVLDIFSGDSNFKFEALRQSEDITWGFIGHSKQTGKQLDVAGSLVIAERCRMTNLDKSKYRAVCRMIYCSVYDKSAIFEVEIQNKFIKDYMPDSMSKKEKLKLNDYPRLLVIVKDRAIVYVTAFDIEAIRSIFGTQLVTSNFLGIQKVYSSFTTHYKKLETGTNENLMQPGFSLFDTLGKEDIINYKLDQTLTGQLDTQIIIQGKSLQDLSKNISLDALILYTLFNTLIIGVDPKNNPLDPETNTGIQSKNYEILVYDLITQQVILCLKKGQKAKGDTTKIDLGEVTIIKKMTLDEAYEQYREYFKYYENAFLIGKTEETSKALYSISFLQMASSIDANKDCLDIEEREDKSYDINSSELLKTAEQLINLGYQGYDFTLEMLLCALSTPLYNCTAKEVDLEDIDKRSVGELVLYGEIDGTTYELVEYKATRNNFRYTILIIDVKTDMIKFLYNGPIEITEFMSTLYTGYNNVQQNSFILEEANRIIDGVVPSDSFIVFNESSLTTSTREISHYDGDVHLCKAIDKRNLDYYLLVQNRRYGTVTLFRFNTIINMLKYLEKCSDPDKPLYLASLYNCLGKMIDSERLEKNLLQIEFKNEMDQLRHLIMRGYTDEDKILISSEKKNLLKLIAKQKRLY